MASDFFRLRTILTPILDMESPHKAGARQALSLKFRSLKFRRAWSRGPASLALAIGLLPLQLLPSLAETLQEQPAAVKAADELVVRSQLAARSEGQTSEADLAIAPWHQTETTVGSAEFSPATEALPAPAKLLAQASQDSLSEAFVSSGGTTLATLLNDTTQQTEVRTAKGRIAKVKSGEAKIAEDAIATSASEFQSQGQLEDSEAASGQISQSSLLLTAGAFDAIASSGSHANDPGSGISPLQQLASQLNKTPVLAVAPPRAETLDEVRSRLAPGIQPLPTPPQLAPVRFEGAPGGGSVLPLSNALLPQVPASNFGGAFANSASGSSMSAPPSHYLAQAYPQAPYSPQPSFQPGAFPQMAPQMAAPQPPYPQGAYPQAVYSQPVYSQPVYPQPGYYYAQPYPLQPVQPGYAPPQPYAPPYPQANYYPQGAYPQPYPPQGYVAQPYPQYPQPYQIQPYASQGYVAYPPAGYPQPAYAAPNYAAPNYAAQPYPGQPYLAPNYAAQPYPQPGYGYSAPGMSTAVQLPPLPAQGSASPSRSTFASGAGSNVYTNNAYTNSAYTNNPYGQPSSIGGRSELPPPPSLSTGNTAFSLPGPPSGLSNATSAAVPPQALSEINLNRLPQIPPDPSPLDVPSASPVAADQLPSGIGGPLNFEAPTLELPPPPLQPRQEVNLPVGQPAPTFRSTALGQPESQLQAVFLTQGGDSAARARLSGTYPMTPNLLFGASFDVASGDAFTDTTEGFSVNEAFASASLAQLPNLRLIAGQMDLTSYFDRNSFAKDSATHFFNPTFQTNPALSAVGLGSRPGVLANWSATDNLDLKVAAYSSSDQIGEFSLDGFAGEVGFRTGNAIVRATYASGRDDGSRDGFQEVFNIDRGNGRTGVREGDREEAYGVNGELFIPSLNAGIFGRYGRYENRDLGEGGDTYSLGLSFLDVFTDEDRLGLAFGRDLSNDDLRRRFDEDSPNVLELFYDFRFLPNLRMGFTLQERDNFSELAAGFRLKAEFDTLPAGNLSEVR